MEALKKKLNSRRGASILLALLFMLMCILVAASVVMAAASNAGKIKSNKEEQQKYLTLSSAVNLLVDELESVEYVGEYEYEPNQEMKTWGEGGQLVPYPEESTGSADSDEEPEEPVKVTVTTYTYTLKPGTLQHWTADDGSSENPPISANDWQSDNLGQLLPMNNYLDYLFKTEYWNKYPKEGKSEAGSNYVTRYIYNCEITGPTLPPGKYTQTLTLTVNDGAPGDLPNQQVEIVVTLEEDGRILLEATLYEKKVADDGTESWPETNYQMVAVLKTQSGKMPVNVINLTATKKKFDPVRWKLAYIYKVKDKVEVV